jgi:hypothetical protein
MVKVKLGLPIDSTFLSEVIYEGLLYLVKNGYAKYFNYKEIEFKEDFLSLAYEKLENYGNIKITLTGNDDVNTKLFRMFNLSTVNSRKILNDLFDKLHSYSNTFYCVKNEINLAPKIKGKTILYDIEDKKEGISLQLLKIDRYTGISSLETNYISQHLTSYFSKELILIALLGIYSSYVTTLFLPSEKGSQQIYYFLFFSPEETLGLLSKGNNGLFEAKFIMKEKMKKIINEHIKSAYLNEVLLLDVILNLELYKFMKETNLDKISTILIKLNLEEKTYKIYETLPITVFKEMVFHKKIEKYFRHYEKFAEPVLNFLNDQNVKVALNSLTTRSKMPEADNLLSAIINLYRFVILGNTQGLSEFIREAWNAYEKTKNQNPTKALHYIELLKKFSYYI